MVTIVTRAGKGSPLTHNEVDANFTNLNSGKAETASPALTGTPTSTTAAVGTNTTQIATTAFVNAEIANDIAGKADLASPALTGTPTSTTAAVGTNTTQIATTAFVNAEIANDAPTKTGTGASGTWGISITGDAATTDGKSFGTFSAAGGIAYATTTTSLAAIAAGTAGQVLVSGGAGAPTWGSVIDYQLFTATGTWTKPSGISANALVIVEIWGAGGGGGQYGGGGGGGYFEAIEIASDLGSTVSVTVGAGGTYSGGATGNAGGNSAFGSYTAYGGGGPAGSTTGGVGAGLYSNSSGDIGVASGSTSAALGSYAIQIWGGAGGGADSTVAVRRVGLNALYGGAGGGGGVSGSDGTIVAGGTSVFGGNGGASFSVGTVPAGGGGKRATGARGEVRVWTIG
jgi:hypothetical protein